MLSLINSPLWPRVTCEATGENQTVLQLQSCHQCFSVCLKKQISVLFSELYTLFKGNVNALINQMIETVIKHQAMLRFILTFPRHFQD